MKYYFYILLFLFCSCQLNKDEVLCTGKVLPSQLFDKYEYQTQDLFIPPPPNDTNIISNYTLFKLSGQMENKIYKVIEKRIYNSEIAKKKLKIASYKENVISELSDNDTLCIFEVSEKDSVSLFTVVLDSKEVLEGGKLLFFKPNDKGEIKTDLYFDFNWNIGDKFTFFNHFVPAGGTSLQSIDTVSCFPVYEFYYSIYSNTISRFYSPKIGFLRQENSNSIIELKKINNISLIDYMNGKCKDYLPILEQVKEYEPYIPH